MSVRTVVVRCRDWAVTAAGYRAEDAVAVVHANRVLACSAGARAEGVRRGLRRREAQGRCPDLVLVQADPERDARTFEAVAAAVEALTPRVEIVAPGTLAVPTRGPSRYFGGDEALAERTRAVADAVLVPRGASCRVGVADGLFAALLAARTGALVERGGSPAFLAPLPVGALDAGGVTLDLVSLLRRLGLRTLGDVAALGPADLLGRFGPEGALASRLARGDDDRPPLPRDVLPELTVSAELDPPAELVETAAFVAKTLATTLSESLGNRGLACTRISIEAETEHGESLARLWRAEGALGPAAIAERMRWQLDGWLNGDGGWGNRPTGGITLLRLVPDQVVADDGRQLGFWGGVREADERAARGIARLQGLLGPDAVSVPERRGGRGPGEQVGLTPAHSARLGTESRTDDADRPWPGRLPAPSPAVVHASPPPTELTDADGRPVAVTGRGLVTADPAALDGDAVVQWAGPWPVDERWWDSEARRRRARLQVVTSSGRAHLLVIEGGQWSVEATYD